MRKLILMPIIVIFLVSLVYAITYGTRSNSCTGCFDYFTRKADNATWADNASGSGITNKSNANLTDLIILGNLNISGWINATGNISFNQLKSCDTINTDANGLLTCGNDATGAGSESTNNSAINVTDIIVRSGINATRDINTSKGSFYQQGNRVNDSIDLSLYNKSISLVNYNQSISLNLYNQSISLVNYNQSISLNNYNQSINLVNYAHRLFENLFDSVNRFYKTTFFFGNVTFGSNATINSSILPSIDNTYSLGNGSMKWRGNFTDISTERI